METESKHYADWKKCEMVWACDRMSEKRGEVYLLVVQERKSSCKFMVTFVGLLLFSSFSDIPGASRIKTCDKSHIKTFKKSSGVKYIWIKTIKILCGAYSLRSWLPRVKSLYMPYIDRYISFHDLLSFCPSRA